MPLYGMRLGRSVILGFLVTTGSISSGQFQVGSMLRWPAGLALVWFGLVSLFIQGKPLASGYYSRHPETTQYNRDKDKEKRKTEERTQKSKSTVAGENSKCSMQQLNIQVSVFIEMRVSQNNNMQLLRFLRGSRFT